ncbi:hypothetical protein CRG98_032602 [Punica granatum]|uniref:Uncharacterized protein n=1 Tax=Punica granatum TaxID=22663 RepID=A0A2I0ISJ6_PUNGR|nr:hypothetical protein CRG98_032602 [Punica granatum]
MEEEEEEKVEIQQSKGSPNSIKGDAFFFQSQSSHFIVTDENGQNNTKEDRGGGCRRQTENDNSKSGASVRVDWRDCCVSPSQRC